MHKIISKLERQPPPPQKKKYSADLDYKHSVNKQLLFIEKKNDMPKIGGTLYLCRLWDMNINICAEYTESYRKMVQSVGSSFNSQTLVLVSLFLQ